MHIFRGEILHESAGLRCGSRSFARLSPGEEGCRDTPHGQGTPRQDAGSALAETLRRRTAACSSGQSVHHSWSPCCLAALLAVTAITPMPSTVGASFEELWVKAQGRKEGRMGGQSRPAPVWHRMRRASPLSCAGSPQAPGRKQGADCQARRRAAKYGKECTKVQVGRQGILHESARFREGRRHEGAVSTDPVSRGGRHAGRRPAPFGTGDGQSACPPACRCCSPAAGRIVCCSVAPGVPGCTKDVWEDI